jgi:hypothetical protein|tara:strand:- start:117 stop:404 length:288 start_codon:yes stop_codon:yes gene_type:complete
MIEFFLALSSVFNVLLVWYIVQLIRRFLSFQDDLDDFSVRLEEYSEHVNIVSSLERFYGDETLGNLLRHSKSLVEECQKFQSIIKQEEEYAEEED